MAARISPDGHVEASAASVCSAVASGLRPGLAATRLTIFAGARAVAGARVARPRLGMLGIPLALVAAVLAEQWWDVSPLAACAWWWAPRESGWEWLVALGRGALAAEWALVGASALATFPDQRIAVGAFWAGVVAMPALAVASSRSARQRTARPM